MVISPTLHLVKKSGALHDTYHAVQLRTNQQNARYHIVYHGHPSIHSVVCVEGHDSDIINNLNGAIVGIDGVPKYSHDYPGFLPHLSFIQYKTSEDFDEVIDYLEEIRESYIGSLLVDSFELVIAELPVIDRYPKLKPLHKFQLV